MSAPAIEAYACVMIIYVCYLLAGKMDRIRSKARAATHGLVDARSTAGLFDGVCGA